MGMHLYKLSDAHRLLLLFEDFLRFDETNAAHTPGVLAVYEPLVQVVF
jgi:hypothetical protein